MLMQMEPNQDPGVGMLTQNGKEALGPGLQGSELGDLLHSATATWSRAGWATGPGLQRTAQLRASPCKAQNAAPGHTHPGPHCPL